MSLQAPEPRMKWPSRRGQASGACCPSTKKTALGQEAESQPRHPHSREQAHGGSKASWDQHRHPT